MPAIQIYNLTKIYNINEYQKYLLIRDKLKNRFTEIFNFKNSEIYRPFYALDNISFSVEPGKVMGIIGLNGAGKSTLLKILSRITPPTRGKAKLRGRVASLLEVGTGFHPELTGRENIFLNGAILGISKQEIKSLFDQIVDFSGVERFLDTPVKRYSSGMFVRLAFSVAAHIQTEVLLVDEVLAVGDLDFQKKCLAKLDDISRGSDKTIIFVSHNLNAIKNICQESVLLDNGKLKEIGETDKVMSVYLNEVTRLVNLPIEERGDRKGNGSVKFIDIMLKDMEGNDIDCLYGGQDAQIWIKYYIYDKNVNSINFSLAFDTFLENYRIATIVTNALGIRGNEHIIKVIIRDLPLNEGKYSLTLYCDYKGQILDWVKNAKVIEVKISSNKCNNNQANQNTKGIILLKYDFS